MNINNRKDSKIKKLLKAYIESIEMPLFFVILLSLIAYGFYGLAVFILQFNYWHLIIFLLLSITFEAFCSKI